MNFKLSFESNVNDEEWRIVKADKQYGNREKNDTASETLEWIGTN